MAEPENIGLRESKKRRTRETIFQKAMELFDANGYQRTTIPQIAEAADVSPRTVYSYYRTKEEIVFSHWGERGEALAAALRERPENETTAEALRAWLLGERELWERREPEMKRQRRVIDSDPNLRSFERSALHEFELLLAESIGRDTGQSPDDLEPRIAAAATVAVFDLLDEERFEGGSSEAPSLSHQLRILDKALAFISAGAMAIRPDVYLETTDG